MLFRSFTYFKVLSSAWRLLAMELCPYALNCQNPLLGLWRIAFLKTARCFNFQPPSRTLYLPRGRNSPPPPPARTEIGPLYDGALKYAWKAIPNQKPEFRRALSTSKDIGYCRSLLTWHFLRGKPGRMYSPFNMLT